MAVQLSTLTLIFNCLSYALSFHSTTIAFSKNAVDEVKISINIVNPLDTAVYVNISAPRISSFTTKQELVPPKDVIVIELDKTDFEITETGVSDKGILITSAVSDLIITGLSIAWNSGDMYFARNASQLGTEYIIITHCDPSYVCQFTVIAYEDNVFIEIMFPHYFAAVVVLDRKEFGPEDVLNLTLQTTQTFQIQSTSDLSGVKIWSTNKKLFSVLSGSSLTSVPHGAGRDYIADMVPPIAAWGTEYILVRRNVPQYAHNNVKFVATTNGANISTIGCGAILHHHIPGFQIYLFSLTCERVHVISDEPVLIAHFAVGTDYIDPAMFFPTPINHYVNKYTVYVPPGFRYCAITLVTETLHANTFNFSKETDISNDWKEIEQSLYSTLWVDNLNSGVLDITHSSSFGGHMICEKEWSNIAMTIGLGNVILKETQGFTTTPASTENLTTQEAFRDTSLTEPLTLSTGNTEDIISKGITSTLQPSAPSTGSISDSTVLSSTTVDVTLTEILPNINASMFNCSCCIMPSSPDSKNLTPEKLLAITNDVKKTLTVSKKTTSKYVRKLTSAWDERESSETIGVIGIIILCVVFGGIVAIDILSLFQRQR